MRPRGLVDGSGRARPARRRAPASSRSAELVAGRDAIASLLHRQMPAGAGIERSVRPVRRVGRGRDLALDLGAAAEAGIDQAALVELVQHLAIVGEMFGLAAHLAVPVEAQPSQVGQDRRLVFALAAADVGVLDAHQEAAAGLARAMPAGPGRIGAEPRCSSPVGLGAKRVTMVMRRLTSVGWRQLCRLAVAPIASAPPQSSWTRCWAHRRQAVLMPPICEGG